MNADNIIVEREGSKFMEKQIIELLEEIKPGEDFTGSNTYVDDGVLDSFDILTLISMLEEQFEIKIDGLDIVPENFQNVKAIIRLIEKSKKN